MVSCQKNEKQRCTERFEAKNKSIDEIGRYTPSGQRAKMNEAEETGLGLSFWLFGYKQGQ